MDEEKSIAGYDPEYEVIETLRDASMEIKQLRDRNGFLQARMSGFDDALLLVRMRTTYGDECLVSGRDNPYRIDNLVEQLQAARQKRVSEVMGRPAGYGVSINGGKVKTKEPSVVKATKTRKFGKRGPMSAEQKAAISATMKKKARAKAKGSKKKN